MPTNDPYDLDDDDIDQEIRINELKEQANELVGGEMTTWESDDCPPEISEQFWKNVVAYESAPVTSSFQELQEASVDLPPAEQLSDEELPAKLWVLIHRLANLGTYIHSTNHLSDRELYVRLWKDSLREEHPAIPKNSRGSWHIDLIGSGSDEHNLLYLKHYASEETRQGWMKDFPNYVMPPHEDPAYDRDRHLPQWIPPCDPDDE